MELKCAIVLTLFSLVTATPHGYGAKGGAAKAEAGAVAGAFASAGVLPLEIPSAPAGGFAGSFSKSSSSSFASSSASSSSSSFSFSGSGANGISGLFGLPGTGGCKTGDCQNGSHGGTDSHGADSHGIEGYNGAQAGGAGGNGIQGYSGAQAAAAAGAIAGSQIYSGNGAFGSSCNGNDCSNKKSSCEGKDCKHSDSSSLGTPSSSGNCANGQCGLKSSSPSLNTNKDCKSGNCGTLSSPSTDNELNDIQVGISGSLSSFAHNSNDFSSNADKTNNNVLKGSAANQNTPQFGIPDRQISPGYGVPAKDLVTPKEESACTTPGCKSSNDKKPSYNTNPNKIDENPCIGGYCNDNEPNTPNSKSNSDSISTNYSKYPTPASAPGSCNTADCSPINNDGSKPYKPSSDQGGPHLAGYNNYPIPQNSGYPSSGPQKPNYTPSLPTGSSSNCASGICVNNQPGHSTGFGTSKPNFSSQPGGVSPNGVAYPSSHNSGPNKFESKPLNPSEDSLICAFGACDYNPTGLGAPTPNIPGHPGGAYPNGGIDCASGKCPTYSSSQYPGSNTFGSTPPKHSEGIPYKPINCASGICSNNPSDQPTGFGAPKPSIPGQPGVPSSNGDLNCASGKCNTYPPSQYPGSDAFGLNPPKYPGGIPKNPINCASGNCGNTPNSGIYKPSTEYLNPTYSQPTYSQGSLPAGSVSCSSGTCAGSPRPSVLTPFISSKPNIPNPPQDIPQSGSGNCAFGNCIPKPSTPFSGTLNSPCATGNCGPKPTPGLSTTLPKIPIPLDKPNNPKDCAFGHCGNPSSAPYGSSGQNVPSYFQGNPLNPTYCASGNCGTYPSGTYPDFQASGSPPFANLPPSGSTGLTTGPKVPIFSEKPSFNGPQNCVTGNCAAYPSSSQLPFGTSGQYPGSYTPESKPPSPTYQGSTASGPSNCANGHCGNIFPSSPTGINTAGSKFPNHPEGPSLSAPGSCAFGNCGNIPKAPAPTFVSSSSKNPSNSPGSTSNVPTNCATGNCANSPQNSPNNEPTQPNQSIPAFVPLGTSGPGALKPEPLKPAGPGIASAGQPSNTGSVPGIPPPSSAFDTSKPNINKDQVYTGGFGGPPGILKPYEFKLPPPGGYLSTPSSPTASSPCSSGNCAPQPGQPGSNYNNKAPETAAIPKPDSCTTGKCDTQSNLPHHGQSGAASGAFAAAAASNAEGAVYTGGFGGPPGILKPFDHGSIGSAANINSKHSLGSQHGYDGPLNPPTGGIHALPDDKLNKGQSYGSQSGAAAFAGASTASFGNNAAGNKAGGCGGGCGSSGGSHDSHGGLNGGLGLSNAGHFDDLTGGLNSAASVAKSVAGASAGTNSFALGGSFASSSAHADSGAATKGGYGR